MDEIGAFEAKNTLGALLDRVERGEEIIITRHGKPVARLVQSAGGVDKQQACAAAQRLQNRGRALQLGPFVLVDWKDERDGGRP